MLKRKATILAKIETTYGTDPTPDGAANAILVSNPNITPMDMKTVSRDLVRTFLGNSEELPTELFSKVSFLVEMAGAGAAGTVPAYGPLLRACGFSQTQTAGVDVVYAPVSDSFESVTIYYNQDGVLHKLTGCRGTVKLGVAVNGRPTFDFEFIGLFNDPADVTAPAVTLSVFKKPLPVNRNNTIFSLHGYAAHMQSLDIDIANQLNAYGLVNDTYRVDITDRKPVGNISMEAVKVATKDWWTTVKNVTTGAMQLVHGTTAGNIVQIDGTNTQISKPTYADMNGTLMLNGSLIFAPGATGNDELTITVK